MLKNPDRENELLFLENMTDEEAERNALSDPDNPPLTDEQLARAVRFYERRPAGMYGSGTQ